MVTRLEGFWRAHQVPLTEVKKNPEQLRILEKWMRDQKPEELFDRDGKLVPELKELAPTGNRRMSANPHANGGILKKALRLPDFRDYALKVDRPGTIEVENVPPLGSFLRDVMKLNMNNFRVFGPDETTSNKLQAVYRGREEILDCRILPRRQGWRRTGDRWTRHRDAQRAHHGGHARRLSAYRAKWLLLLL